MKKIYVLFILIVMLSCVEDPEDLSTSNLFEMRVDNQELSNTNFIANNTTLYLIQLKTLNGVEIKNNKAVTISVSDGGLVPRNNLSVASTQISVNIIDGALSFYFIAGRKSKINAALSATVEGFTQTFTYDIKPSEPDLIVLSTLNLNPHVTSSLDLTATLKKNNQADNFVSNDLPIHFNITPINPLININQSPTDFSLSNYNDNLGVIAKTTLTNINQVTGSVEIFAYYTKQDNIIVPSNTITINYIP